MTAPGSPMAPADPQAPGYPPARRDDLAEDLHGQRVPDPYRWLEDAASADTQEWLAAQDALWAAAEAGLPGRSRLAARLQELMAAGYVGAPAWRGSRQFFMRRLPGQEHGALLTAAPGEPERVLIDPAALDPAGLTTLDSWQPDQEGRLLAYQLSSGGDEESQLRVLDVVSGAQADGPISRCRYSPVAWLPGGQAFYYVRKLPPGQVPPGEEQFHRRVYLHTVGTPAEQDVLIFGAGRDKTNYYGVSVSRDGRWLVISAAQGTAPRNDVWLADLAGSGPAAPLLQVVQEGVDARTGVHVGRDGRLYVFTDAGAPRGRLAVSDPAHPEPDRWRDLVGQDPTAILTDFAILDGAGLDRPVLVVSWTRHAVSEITVHDLATGERTGTLALPGTGHAGGAARLGTTGGISARPEGGHEAWFGYTDNTTPSAVYHYDARTGEVSRWAQAPGAVEVPDVCTRQVTFTSKDGTEVAMLVISAGPGGDPRGTTPRASPGRPSCTATAVSASAWCPPTRRPSWPGWRPAACTRSRRCAAAVRRARTGTGRGCASTSRPCSTTSTRRRRPSSPAAGPARGSWASPAARTAGCWSGRPSPSGRTVPGRGVLGPAAGHGAVRAVRARPDLERRVRQRRGPGRAGLAARLLPVPPGAAGHPVPGHAVHRVRQRHPG